MFRAIWVALLLAWAVSAAPPKLPGFLGPGVRSLKLEETLPGSTAYVLAQGRDGRLWAGTSDGLALFSGMAWKPVAMGPERRFPAIRALLATRDGSLWVGTEWNWLWRLKDGQWTWYSPATGVPFRSARVPTLLETRNAAGQPVLWAGTERGVARFEEGRWSFQGTEEGLPDPMVWKLREVLEPNGETRIWAATAAGVARLRGDRWEPLRLGPEFGGGLHANDILCVPTAAGGREVWVSLWNVGLACWDGVSWRRHGPKEGFPGRNPTSLAYGLKGSRQVIWAGTYGAGLAWYDGTWHRLGRQDGFPSAFVLDVQAVPGGKPSVIAATKTAGILAVDQGGWSSFVGWQGLLPSEIVTCFAEEPIPGRLPAMWMGTTDGIVRWDGNNGTMKTYSEVLAVSYIQALLPRTLPGGGWGLWVGTLRGLMTFDGRTWKRLGRQDGFPEGLVSNLAETRDRDGQPVVWVGYSKGLAWLEKGHWTFQVSSEALPESGTTGLLSVKDPDGEWSLWVGTRNRGIRRFRKGEWTTYGTQSGLPSLGVTALRSYQDGRHRSWILAGTSHGELAALNLDQPDARWIGFPRETLPAVPDSPIWGIEVDLGGRLYLISQRGIARVAMAARDQGLEARQACTYTWGDGLPSSACLTSLRDSSGRVWVGTSNGAAVLDPREETAEVALPAPCVLRAESLPGQIEIAPGAVLGFRQNHLLFDFGLPVHHRFDDTRFRTELVGAEEPGPWERNPFREFSSLPAGRHTLRVWARSHTGAISGPTDFSFRIRPAPWASHWALALYLASASALVVLLYQRRTRYLVRRNRALEAKVEARTRLLEATNQALAEQNLRDPLTGLRNRRYVADSMDRDVAQVLRAHRPGSGQIDPNRALLFLMVDLDHFKPINDLHGHRAGDAVLVQTAQVLCRAMRESDSIVRWGGEEFLGIARGLNPAEATVLAERIRSFVAAHPYEIAPGLTITVTCSVGFAVFPIFADQPDALPWERAIELADECLYEAKRSGRNRWVGLLAKPGAAAPVSSDHLPHARALADAGLVTWVQLEP